MNKPNTQVASCETWRRYGVMIHDTTDTLGGMHRIEIKPKNQSVLCGPAVAFTFTQEQADHIVKAVNCHEDLLSACLSALTMFNDSMFVWGKDDENEVARMVQSLHKAVNKAIEADSKAGTK